MSDSETQETGELHFAFSGLVLRLTCRIAVTYLVEARSVVCYFRSSFYADQHKFLRRQFFNHEDTQVQIVDAPWPESAAYGAAEMAENEKWSAGDTAI